MHAERGAAQSERVLVAGRHLADAEHAGERLELVGERDRLRDAARGQRVAGEARPVVLLDRVGDRRRLAVVLRVVASHHALQLGELADHVGDEIGLREQRRAVGGGGVGAELRGDLPREEAEPVDAIRLRAELVVVDDAAQPVDARGERLPAILVEEELRVGEPRAQHALVAGDDRRGIVRLEVATSRKRWLSLPSRVGEREVFLVLLHRQDQALLRHREERRIEAARVDDRPLDQRRDLVEQRVGRDQRRAVRLRRRAPARSPRGARRTTR